MKTTFNDQTTLINHYNEQAYDTQMSALMGEEVWAKHRPTKNLSDFLSSPQNDNKREGK